VAWAAEKVGLDAARRERFALAVQEAAANVVRHAGERGLMEVIQDDQHRLVVKIIDHGPGMAPGRTPALPPPDALEGRGLWLASAMCDRMQINSDASGTTVVLEMTLGGG
jgi:anti-sigma regulatory factor (Ser/Thr protein kinase)